MSDTALLVIDVQDGLCSGPWAAHGIEAVIGRINTLARQARAAGAPVVFVQHEEADGPLRHGEDGWQLDPRLDVQPADLRIRKTTPDAFRGTGLQAALQARGVDRLVVCGLQSEYCVDSSVRAALALGHPVTLVGDAHSTVDNGVLSAPQIVAHHNATLAGMQSFGPRVQVLPAAEVVIGAG